MNPKDYQKYALSIDIFSNPLLNEGLKRYLSLIVGSVPHSSYVCDVGGGTGYQLNLILKQRQDLIATLIEPSQPMFKQAQSLLGSSEVKLINSTLQKSLPSLTVQNAFFFCRSLYAFSGDINDYKTLFLQLKHALSDFGQLFIYEISDIYDVAFCKKTFEEKLIDQEGVFNQHWPVLENALLTFNEGVKNGEFTLFSYSQLKTLAFEAGFDLQYYSNPGLYCFRKKYSSGH